MAEKRRRKVIWAGLAAALMLVCGILFASCGGGYTPSQSDSHVNGQSSDTAGDSPSSSEIEIIEVTSVSLNKTSLTLEVGESETLTATVLPDDATDKNVIWSSSSESVAAVNDGTVRALSSGTATIIATTSNGKAAVCSVTVTDPVVEVSSVTLNKSELTLEVDESETLTATVLPGNATDKSVTWTSSAPAVATVAGGKVTAVGGGTATITAETSNGKTAICTVMVSDPYADFSFTLSGSGYILAAYSGTDTEVTVPAEYKGKAVAVIGSRAFYDCSFITKIILPDSLKEIGDVAFGYCTSLQTVEIPACTRVLNSVFLGCTSLREVTLPDGVVTDWQQFVYQLQFVAKGDDPFGECFAEHVCRLRQPQGNRYRRKCDFRCAGRV